MQFHDYLILILLTLSWIFNSIIGIKQYNLNKEYAERHKEYDKVNADYLKLGTEVMIRQKEAAEEQLRKRNNDKNFLVD